MLSFWIAAVGRRHHAGQLLRPGRPRRGGLDRLRAALGRARSTPASTGARTSGCISLFVLGVSSMMGSINYITTIINMRAPGMTLFRHAADDLVAVHHRHPAPAGAAGADRRRVAMLLFDRTLGTDWFDPVGRRRAAALAAPVLVLRPPRGLHHDPAGHGHGLGRSCRRSRASRSSATADGLLDDRASRSCRGSSGATTCSRAA